MWVEVTDEEARVLRGVLEHNSDAIIDGWNMGWGELATLLAKFEPREDPPDRVDCRDCRQPMPSGPAYMLSGRCGSCYDLWMASADREPDDG